jgi:hypothetical protein
MPSKLICAILATLFFQILLVCSSIAWADEPGAWRADISTPQGQISLLTTIQKRHGSLIRSMTRYRGRPASVLNKAALLGAQINPDFNLMTPGLRLAISPNTQAFADYDPQKVEALRKQLYKRRKRFLANEFSSNGDIVKDFAKIFESSKDLPKQANGQRRRNQVLTDFLAMAPFFYTASGHRLGMSAVGDVISKLSAAELEDRFHDVLLAHLLPRLFPKKLDDGFLIQCLARFRSQFLEKQVNVGLQKVLKAGGEATAQVVTLEEAPKLVALFRGAIGCDCSMESVPLYPIHKSVRVFWIRTGMNFDAPPKGYILSVDVVDPNAENQIRPFIVTVNGTTLKAGEVRSAALALLSLYGKPTEALVSKADSVVNSTVMDQGLWSDRTSSASLYEFEPPSDWSEISKVWKKNIRYGDFYDGKRLGFGMRFPLSDEELQQISTVTVLPSVQAYPEVKDLEELSVYQRAMISLDFKTLSALKVTGVQNKAAKEFSKIMEDGNGELSKIKNQVTSHVTSLAKRLEIPVLDLLKELKIETRVAVEEQIVSGSLKATNPSDLEILKTNLEADVHELVASGKRSFMTDRDLLVRTKLLRKYWPLIFKRANKHEQAHALWPMFYSRKMTDPLNEQVMATAKAELSLAEQVGAVKAFISIAAGDEGPSQPWPEWLWRWAIEVQDRSLNDESMSVMERVEQSLENYLIKDRFPDWILPHLLATFPKSEDLVERRGRIASAIIIEARLAQLTAIVRYHKKMSKPELLQIVEFIANILEKDQEFISSILVAEKLAERWPDALSKRSNVYRRVKKFILKNCDEELSMRRLGPGLAL